jgi:hypothetical protein
MKNFAVFCLSTLGGLTLLAVVAASGAAGLYYWHGEGGCAALPRCVRVTTESAGGTRVYELATPRSAATPPPEPPAAESPVAALATEAPAPPAVAGPTADALAALRAELAAALRRVAELEADRAITRAPAPVAPPRAEDF